MLVARPTNLPLAVGFALVSALVALIVMHALGTSAIDTATCRVGVVVSAAMGGATALSIMTLRQRSHLRWLSWLLFPVVGAVLGAAVQWFFLKHTPRYLIIVKGMTSDEPFSFVLAGVPFGVAASVAVALVFHGSRALVPREPAADDGARALVLLAGLTTLGGALTLGALRRDEIELVVVIIGLAAIALGYVLLADYRRTRFLADVFAGAAEGFEIAPLGGSKIPDLPLVVGGITPAAILSSRSPERYYRLVARDQLVLTSSTLEETLRPLVKRRRVVGVIVALVVVAVVSRL